MQDQRDIKQMGRAGSMEIDMKDGTKDITRVYFNHPIWTMKWGDPVPYAPLDIQLELINRCNLRCEFCSGNHHTRPKSLLSREILWKIADEAAKEGVCYFTICGIGEASLHPDLFAFLRHIRDKKVEPKGLRVFKMMPTVLISNGVWNAQQVKECIENPPDLLSLSLAGLTDEEIAKRRDQLNLKAFYRNVKEIYENRYVRRDEDGGIVPVIHISTHIYPYEIYERKDDIIEFKNKWFDVSDAIVTKTTEIGTENKKGGRYLETKTPASPYIANLSYKKIDETSYQRTAPCMEVSRRLSIDSDGNVWCGHHNSEEFGTFFGNVYQESIMNIWHSDKMNEFRKQVRAGIFHRRSCLACGGEIREWHREATNIMENEIHFSNIKSS